MSKKEERAEIEAAMKSFQGRVRRLPDEIALEEGETRYHAHKFGRTGSGVSYRSYGALRRFNQNDKHYKTTHI